MTRLFARALWLLLGWVELLVFTLLLYGLSFLPAAWRGTWYRHLFQAWSRTWIHALGVDLRMHHKNIHPLPGRYILIANHPSSFEDVGIPSLFDVDSLAKHEVRDWWLVGRISAAAGTIFVQRDSRASRTIAAQQIKQRLEQGRSVALYPEGGIKGPRLQPSFRHGAFAIAMQTGIPIVPVYLHYEASHDFHWGPHSLVRNMRNIIASRNNRANYYVFDAIEPHLFHDKISYCQHVHGLYQRWQARYLD
ncbi:MAG: 1-acyl-sn-glycerol-3-phosphate acyltransferase [Gammaproteobacteria bacterium]|nr:1-acyl-sn-glycerol-3-phosphate acyltransferase [Gammaproteobacteria bacterium]MCP5431120.1 1-acyl-sn-glycerol-3-phosphate acyltransferase [Chromatiaceae bacterium]MCP5436790.1 1-acyl-sn-glycerol-3-phosphate acyltransferase [Chromatiaceae bacterium]MCP5440833.1 1-acyl-sn-glycerol-3-phosphate acyltransferase [Chromatiaceae bacterium]